MQNNSPYERRALEVAQKDIETLQEELQALKDWKRDCDQMSKVWLRIAMAISLLATSLGVWLDNIRGFFKFLSAWIHS